MKGLKRGNYATVGTPNSAKKGEPLPRKDILAAIPSDPFSSENDNNDAVDASPLWLAAPAPEARTESRKSSLLGGRLGRLGNSKKSSSGSSRNLLDDPSVAPFNSSTLALDTADLTGNPSKGKLLPPPRDARRPPSRPHKSSVAASRRASSATREFRNSFSSGSIDNSELTDSFPELGRGGSGRNQVEESSKVQELLSVNKELEDSLELLGLQLEQKDKRLVEMEELAQIYASERQSETLPDQLQRQDSNWEAIEATYEEEIKHLKKQLEAKQNEIISLGKSNGAETERARLAVVSLEEMMGDYKALKEETGQIKQRTVELETETSNLTRERNEWKAMAKTMETSLANRRLASSALDELQQKVDARTNETEELRGVVSEFEKELEAVNADRDMWRTKAEDAVSALENPDRTRLVEEMKVDLMSAHDQIQQLKSHAGDLKQQVDALTDERKKCHSENLKITEKAATAESQLKSQESTYKQELAVLQDDVLGLQNQNVKLEAEFRQMTEERDHWKYVTESVDEDASKAHESLVSEYTEEAKDLRMQNGALEAQVEELCGDRETLKFTLEQAEVDFSKTTKVLEEQLASERLALSSLQEQSQKDNEAFREKEEGLQKTIAELESDMSVLRAEKDKLAGSTATAAAASLASAERRRIESARLQSEVSGLRRDSAVLSSQLQQVEAERDELKTTNDKLMLEEEELRTTISNLESDFGALRSEKDTFEASAVATIASSEKTRGEIATLQSEIGYLRRDKAKLSSELQTIESEHDRLKTAGERSTLDGEELRETISKLESDLASLRTDKESLESSTSVAAAASLASTEKMSSEIASLQSELGDLQRDNSELSSQLYTVQDERDQWKAASEKSTVEEEKLRTTVSGLESDLASLRTDKESLESSTSVAAAASLASTEKMSSEIASLQSELGDLQRDNSELSSQLYTVQDERDQWKAASEKSTVEEEKLRTTVSGLESDLASLRTDKESLESSTSVAAAASLASTEKMSSEIASLQSELGDLQRDNSELSSQLHTVQDERDQWKAASEKSTVEEEKLRTTVSGLESDLASLRTDKENLESSTSVAAAASLASTEKMSSEIASLQSELGDLQRDKSELSSQLHTVQDERDQWKAASEKSTVEEEKLRTTVSGLESDLASLRTDKESLESSTSVAAAASLASTEKMSSEIASLQSELGDLQRDNSELSSQLLRVENERDEWKAASEQLKVEGEKQQTTVSGLESDLSALLAEKKRLEESMQASTEMVDELRKRGEELELTIEQLQQERDEVEMSLEAVVSSSSYAEKQRLETAFAALSSEADELRMRHLERTNEIEGLLAERDKWKAKAESVNWDGEGSPGEPLSANQAGAGMIVVEELRERNEALERQIERLTNERWNDPNATVVDDLRIRNSILESQLEMLTVQENSSGTGKNNDSCELREQISVLEKRVESLAQENEELQRFAGSNGSVRALDTSSLALYSLRDENQEDKDAFQRKEQELQTTIIELETDLAALRADKERLEASTTAATTALSAKTRGEIADLQSGVSGLRQDNAKLSSQLRRVQDERDKWKKSSENSAVETAAAVAASRTLSKSNKELSSLREEAKELRQLVSQYEIEIESLEADGDESKAMAESAASLASANLTAAKAAAQKQVHERNQMVEELQKRSAEMELEIEQLTEERDGLQLASKEAEASDKGTSTSFSSHNELEAAFAALNSEADELRMRNLERKNEIESLLSERDKWKAMAEELEQSPEATSRETRVGAGMIVVDDLREQVVSLEERIATLTLERDEWMQAAAGSSSSKTVSLDLSDPSNSSASQDARGERRSRWGFGRSQHSSDHSLSADSAERSLDLSGHKNQAMIGDLQSEIALVKANWKEESHVSKKKIELLEQENQAYELKAVTLERELERLSSKIGNVDNGEMSSGDQIEVLEQQKSFLQSELDSVEADFEKMQKMSGSAMERLTEEVNHLKTIQTDYQAGVNALEKMIAAMEQENNHLRSIRAGTVDEIAAQKFQQDEKDTKIAQLHYELVKLRMELDTARHEDLKQKVVQLERERLQALEENRMVVEAMQAKLRSKEQDIEALEETLEMQMNHNALHS